MLGRAGLVTRGHEAQWRPAALKAGPLKEVDEWVERYRVIWEQRLKDELPVAYFAWRVAPAPLNLLGLGAADHFAAARV